MNGLLPLDRAVMWLTWRQLFARRRIWVGLAFALAPLILALVFEVVGDDGRDARVHFFGNLGREIVLGTLLPVAAMVFATTAFGGEVDDGTLIYLLVKPIARWRAVLSKLVVTILSTFAVAAIAIALPWFVLRGPDLPARVPLALLGGAGVASVAYCAIFLALGLYTRRALVVALLYILLFEDIISRGLVGVKAASVREYAVSVTQSLSNGTLSPPTYVVPMSTVELMGSIIVVVAVVVTMRRLAGYEMAERL